MIQTRIATLAYLLIAALLLAPPGFSQTKNPEWDKVVEAAKKEGRVVVSIPTSAELRKEFESGFQKAYPGIELELNVARGASNINKIAEEQNAGVRSIDLHIGGTTSIITGLLAPNFLEPVMPSMILPEVRDPKHWWGGHIWADNAKRYVYSFTAYMTETIWYNSTLVKPEEINSWDSLVGSEVEGKDRHPGPALAGLRRIELGVFAEDQRRTVSRQARGSGDDGRA